MDTADKVSHVAQQADYELIAMGIPMAIDNNLAYTDHCPGFGSPPVAGDEREVGKATRGNRQGGQ